MRRLFLTFAVSVALLVAGALIPDRVGPQPSHTPFDPPANANLV